MAAPPSRSEPLASGVSMSSKPMLPTITISTLSHSAQQSRVLIEVSYRDFSIAEVRLVEDGAMEGNQGVDTDDDRLC